MSRVSEQSKAVTKAALDELLNPTAAFSASASPAQASLPKADNPLDTLLVPDDKVDLLNEFHNPKVSPVQFQHEKPEHRAMIWLKAQGFSNKEIAEKMGYTPVGVSLVMRQDWAQALLIQILNENGGDRVQSLLQASAEDSIFTLIELRDDPEQMGTVRRAAADSLLDRYLGKPKQQVDVVQHRTTGVEDVASLDKQIADLRRQEAQILGEVQQGTPAQQPRSGDPCDKDGKEAPDGSTTLAT